MRGRQSYAFFSAFSTTLKLAGTDFCDTTSLRPLLIELFKRLTKFPHGDMCLPRKVQGGGTELREPHQALHKW